MYNQAVKQKEAKKYKSALKLLNQIIAENNDDYWVAAAKNQKENMYVVTSKAINQTKSEDLQIKKTDNSKPDSYYKKLYGRARQLEKGKRFDEAFEVLDQIINDNSSVKWVKYAKGQKKNVEISKVKHDQYLERRRLSDIKFQKERKEINKKKNAEFIAQWEKNIESMEEGRKHNEKIATQKKAAAKERARQIIKNNNERYPLSDLKFSEDSVINFYKLKIGKTKKSDAINIYGTMLKKEFAKEISEDDIVFTLRKALNGPRTIQKTLFVEQSSLQIHDNITFQCYKYFGKSQSKIVNDCLYFYKDILVGGLFDVGQNNCGTNCDLALQTVKYLSSFFPEKIHSSSNKGTHRLGRTNDNFLFNSLIWGYHTKTTKTTTKTFLAPVGTSNYSNNTKNSAEICIFPKEFLKVLSGYGEKGLYTCN